MQKYNQDRPVARASEILADRWTLLIVRELILGGHRFNEIERGLPGISRSLLASRLRDLESAGVIERLPGARSKVAEYHLSDAGRDLKPVVEALGEWGVRWAFGEPKLEELDAGLLVWRIHQRIDRDLLPERRTVIEFDFTGPRGCRVWLVLQAREVSVCVTPPRFDADLVVRADLAFFYRLWLGHVSTRRGEPMRSGRRGRATDAGQTASSLVFVESDVALCSCTRTDAGDDGLSRAAGAATSDTPRWVSS